MARARTIAIAALSLLIAVTAVQGGAIPDDAVKMHYPQWPDLDVTGLNVLDGPIVPAVGGPYEKYLADDFRCTATGPITEIVIWGSYRDDLNAFPPLFNLAIYSDIPAGQSPTGYSMPDAMLWHWYGQAALEEVYAAALDEGFYDPNPDEVVGSDTVCWKYVFHIDPAEAFEQTEDTIYWLGVHHSYDLDGSGVVDSGDESMLLQIPEWAYGWKTSIDHFNDDAVWCDVTSMDTDGRVQGQGPWNELRFPDGHIFAGDSIDLSFVIVPEPSSVAILVVGAVALAIRRRYR